MAIRRLKKVIRRGVTQAAATDIRSRAGTRVIQDTASAARQPEESAPRNAECVPRARILIVDDHPVVRNGMAQIINQQPDMVMCGEAQDAWEALSLVPKAKPDVAVVDITMRGMKGIELARTLRYSHPSLRILMFTVCEEDLYAERAMKAGANGYIMKDEPAEKVIAAIRAVAAGGVYVSESLSKRLVESALDVPSNNDRHRGVASLSDRELEIFSLIGKGLTARRISEELHIGLKTVETHCTRTRRKLGLGSTRELVYHAVSWAAAEAAGKR